MQDYEKVTSASMASATTAETAVTAVTLSDQARAICVDNGFDQDVVVVVAGCQLMYVRAGLTKTLDLSADNSSVPRTRTVQLFCPDGAPTSDTSQFAIVDCLL